MVSVPVSRSLVVFAVPCALCVLMFGCSSSKPASTETRSPEFWGDLKPIVSVKELMRDMIEPAAYNIFNSVSTVVGPKGRIARTPKTDEDWDRIRFGAVTLIEGIYLLKIPRPFTPPGDENDSEGPNPSELSPKQILAKLEKDPVLWNAKIEAIRNVGLEVLDIVKHKRVEELWDAGDNLEVACESCHEQYWYPNQPNLMRKLDRRLEELYGPRADRVR
jgi:hypothetical protein